jgi:hypothetical protein
LMKKKEKQGARSAFKIAIDIGREIARPMNLAATLMRWLDGGFAVDPQRLLAEQKRQNYLIVRRDKVDPGLAIELSDADLMAVTRI